MRRFIILTSVMSIFLLAMGTSVAVAQTSGVHFTRNGEPSCTITCTTPTAAPQEGDAACDAQIAGVGGTNIVLSVVLGGGAVYNCQNQGGQTAPGQNVVLIGPAVSDVTVPGSEVKNGKADLEIDTAAEGGVSLTAPPTVSGADAGCPNPTWTGVNPDLSVTSITFSATQSGVTLFSCKVTGTTDLCGTTINFTDDQCEGVARF